MKYFSLFICMFSFLYPESFQQSKAKTTKNKMEVMNIYDIELSLHGSQWVVKYSAWILFLNITVRGTGNLSLFFVSSVPALKKLFFGLFDCTIHPYPFIFTLLHPPIFLFLKTITLAGCRRRVGPISDDLFCHLVVMSLLASVDLSGKANIFIYNIK